MPFKYIGRTTDFKGKTLWEILGNLKNFGVGRIVVRSMFERYPEPSYMKIMKVETLPNEESRKVRVWVEKTFRGHKHPKLVEICAVSYKTDYRLIHKHEEDAYCHYEDLNKTERILPRYIDFPPLLKELIIRDKLVKGEDVTEPPKLLAKYLSSRENRARVVKEGETPNVESVCGLGTPVSPSLYKGIDI